MYPTKRCPRCNDPGKDFRPASMGGVSKKAAAAAGEGVACKENLKPRGHEYGFSLKHD